MTNIEELAPIIIKAGGNNEKPAPGEEIISFNNKAKTIVKVEPGKLEKVSGDYQNYRIAFNRKYNAKIDQIFELEDIQANEFYQYEIHYSIWLEASDPGRWQHAIQKMLSEDSPRAVLDKLILQSVKNVAGLNGKAQKDSEEGDNLLLKALEETPEDREHKTAFEELVNTDLNPNGFSAAITLKTLYPEFAPIEFDLEIVTPIKAFPGEITIQAKGCIEKDDTNVNLARKKQYLVNQYNNRIADLVKSYFSEEITIQALQPGINHLATKAQARIDSSLKEIGHKLVYLNFSTVNSDVLPAKKIKTEFMIDCSIREFSEKVSFLCQLDLMLNPEVNAIRWKTKEETIDWAKRIILDIIENSKNVSILDHCYSDSWEEFNKQFKNCGYHVNKEGFKITPDIEPIRLKERGFRLDFEQEFQQGGISYPNRFNIIIEGKLSEQKDALAKLKPYLGDKSIIEQVKEKATSIIYAEIKLMATDKLHLYFRSNHSAKERVEQLNRIKEKVQQTLLDLFNIVLDSDTFDIRLIDSLRIQREQELTAGLREINFSIAANLTTSRKMKGEFKITYLLENISEEGWNILDKNSQTELEKPSELEQIEAIIEEDFKSKILNSNQDFIAKVLSENYQGGQELEKLMNENKALPPLILEQFGIKIKFNSIRKLNIEAEQIDSQEQVIVKTKKLAILQELQDQLLVLLEKRKKLFADKNTKSPALDEVNKEIEKIQLQADTYEKSLQAN